MVRSNILNDDTYNIAFSSSLISLIGEPILPITIASETLYKNITESQYMYERRCKRVEESEKNGTRRLLQTKNKSAAVIRLPRRLIYFSPVSLVHSLWETARGRGKSLIVRNQRLMSERTKKRRQEGGGTQLQLDTSVNELSAVERRK